MRFLAFFFEREVIKDQRKEVTRNKWTFENVSDSFSEGRTTDISIKITKILTILGITHKLHNRRFYLSFPTVRPSYGGRLLISY